MQGAPFTMEMAVFLITVIGFVAGVWWRIEARIEVARMAAARAEAELASYKTHVAETYITKEGLREQMAQLMTGIAELKSSITGLHSRIDSAMSHAPVVTPRPRKGPPA